MKLTDPQIEKETAGAWILWNALHEFANTLWERYEDPFLEICRCELGIEPPNFPEVDLNEFDEDDIPF